MKKLIFISIISSFIIVSCSKSEIPENSNSSTAVENSIVDPNVLLRKTIETTLSSGNTYTTNYYYVGKKIDKLVQTSGSGVSKTYTYTYLGDLIDKIVEVNNSTSAITSKESFIYDSNNRLITDVYITYSGSMQFGYKYVYTYNSDGTVNVKTYTGDATSQTTPTAGYKKFYFQNGEVVKEESYSDSSALTSTTTYTYDTKNDPLVNVVGMDKFSLNKGIVSSVKHNQLTAIGTFVQDLSTFDYGTNNFPTKEYIKNPSTNTATGTEEFFY